MPLLLDWFRSSARELPWRTTDPASGRRDPYRVLVSEVMLQQTQVSRVLEKFDPFLARFPSVRALAAAPLDSVLAAWTGLGYYRRARLLHAAARDIVSRFSGVVPADHDDLLSLPGIGRYTAGAIASLAHNTPAPIVDANVSRVLLRIRGKQLPSAQVWQDAEALVQRAHQSRSAGLLNESLMELGALVCLPRSPRCDQCPLRNHCRAHALNITDRIPRPKRTTPRRRIVHSVLIVRDSRGRFLVEQRPPRGLWAGLWQAPTVETSGAQRPPAPGELCRQLCARTKPRRAHKPFLFSTTHRCVEFRAHETLARAGHVCAPRRWVSRAQLAHLAMSSPQRRLLLGTP